jgi:hypothetical protein
LEETCYGVKEGVGPLQLGDVAALGNHREGGVGKQVAKGSAVCRRDYLVGITPQYEGRHGDAMGALGQAALGDRPGELGDGL